MARELAMIPQKYQKLLFAFFDRKYRSERGSEFAMQGFTRRLRTLRRCIDRVFVLLPPESGDIPTDEAREDATIALQAFIFNVFGCLDNLARVWVEEKSVRKPDGSPLRDGAIGFAAKYDYVRQSFSERFRAYLQTREEWFVTLEGYRHALAHRIPIYIPPHCVHPDNESAYKALEHQIDAAVLAVDDSLEAMLQQQQRALMFFRPWITHSYKEAAPIMVIHPQMIIDFNTVDEIAHRMLEEFGS
jgi:hypothetical protein